MLTSKSSIHSNFLKLITGSVFFLALFFHFYSPSLAISISLNDPIAQDCFGSQRTINLIWTSDIHGNPTYYIWRKSINGNYAEIGNTSNLSYNDDSALSDKNYLYQIRATITGNTYLSNEVPANANYCPAVISALNASCQANGPHNQLSWSAVSGNLLRYEVYRDSVRIGETVNTNYDDGLNVSGTENSKYFIKTIWANNMPKDSNPASVIALACPPSLTVNSSCNNASPGGPAASLFWNNLLGVTSYEIYRKAQSETDYSPLDTIASPAISYTDSFVLSLSSSYWQGGNVNYRIKAIWASANKISGAQQISILRCSPFLTTSAMCDTSGNPEIHFNWTKTADANLYSFYRDGFTFSQENNPVDYLNAGNCTTDGIIGKCEHSYRVEASVSNMPNFVSNTVLQSIDCATIVPPAPDPVLSEPSGFCENGRARINLNWSPSNNMVYYTIYRNGQLLINLSNTSISYTDGIGTSIESGTNYTYNIIAFGRGGTRTSLINSKTILSSTCAPLVAPSLNLSKFCSSGSPRVSLSWSAVANAVSYEIKKGTSAGSLVYETTLDNSFTSWPDSNVNPSTLYYYQIIAKGVSGVSSVSSATPLITTDSCFPSIPTVAITRQCVSGSAQNTISWTSDNANTNHYEIFRQDFGGGLAPIAPNIPLSGTSYLWTDFSVSQTTSYSYKVEAVGFSDSQRSTQGYKSTTSYTCSLPGAFTLTDPPNVYCQGSYLRSELNWGISANATRYDVVRNKLKTDNSIDSTVTLPNQSSPYTDMGFGNALLFDGVNDYIDVGNPASLQLTGSMTVSAWVYVNAYGANNPRIISKSGSSRQRGWGLNLENDGKVVFSIASSGAAQVNASTAAGFAKTGQWLYYIGVYQAGTALRLYENGIEVAANTTSIPATQYNSTNNVLIGSRSSCSYCYFKGLIDEVRVYNRALSSAEALEQWKGIYSNETGIKGLWHFNEGSGSVTSDSSNYGNTGVLNGPLWAQNGLDFQTKYNWNIEAKNNGGTTHSNTTAPLTMPLCQPTKPGLVLAPICSGASKPATDLKWSYSINANKFKVYRDDDLIKTIIVFGAGPISWTDDNDDDGLTTGTNYDYYIEAIGPTGLINQSDSISTTAMSCAVPLPPANLTAAFDCGGTGNSYPQANLNWDASVNAIYYTIYRNPSFSSPPTRTTTLTSYTDISVNVNTAYTYNVVAYGSGGPSGMSDPANIAVEQYCSPSVAVVSGSSACVSNNPSDTIYWTDDTAFNTDNTPGYKIYRNTSNNFASANMIQPINKGTLLWLDNDPSLVSLTDYYYWIKTFGPAGNVQSISKKITTLGCGIVPNIPTGLSAGIPYCVENKPFVDLSWNNSANALSYNIFRTNPDSSTSTYSTVQSSYTDKGSGSLKFDGTDDFVDITPTISNLNGATIEAWIKPDSFLEAYGTIYIAGYQSNTVGFNWLIIGVNSIDYQFADSTGVKWPAESISWVLGQWYHVVVAHDYARKEVKFYINGNQIGSTKVYTNNVLPVSNQPVKIGAYQYSLQHKFHGSIDEVRIYDRPLSGQEVLDHKNNIYKNETGLQGAWHFDEKNSVNILDSSGNGRNGKIAGPEWVMGKLNGALEFAGLNGYVQLPLFNLGPAITVEAWVYSENSFANWARIIDFGNGSSNNNIVLSLYGNTGKMIMRSFQGSNDNYIITDEVFPENQWVHVVATINETGNARIYWDGIVKKSGIIYSPLFMSRSYQYIGKSNWGGDSYFKGKIDEFRIYRRALASTEVLEHKNGIFNNENELIQFLNLDEKSGIIATDNSTFGNNGTLKIGAERMPVSAPSIFINSIEGNKLYKYTVKAIGADTESGFSNEVSFTSPSCLPSQPSLTVTSACNGQNTEMSVSWPLDSNTSYWIIHKKRSSESNYDITFPSITTTLIPYVDTNIASGTSYDYYVTAYAYGGSFSTVSESARNNLVSACFGSPVKPVITVTPLCRMKINWAPYNNTGTLALSFNVYRKKVGESNFIKINEGLPESSVEYYDGNIVVGDNYSYRIEAVGSGNNYAMSDITSASEGVAIDCSDMAPFNQPILSINTAEYTVATGGAVSMKWTDTENELKYKIFRRNQTLSEAFDYNNPLVTILPGSDYIDNPNPGIPYDIYYTDYTVMEDTRYEYQIIAINNAGGPDAGIIRSSPYSADVPIAPPDNFILHYSTINQHTMSLYWDAAANSPAGGLPTYTLQKDSTNQFTSPEDLCSNTFPDILHPADCAARIFEDDNASFSERFYRVIAHNNGGDTASGVISVYMMGNWKEVIPR